MAPAALMLLLLAPVLETFDGPLDPLRWYLGVPDPPAKGALVVPKGGWIASRGIEDDHVERIAVVFRHKGGVLEVTIHDAREPLSSPVGEPLVVERGKGQRTLVLTRAGAELDGEACAWKGALRGTVMLRALKGAIELDEVSVDPRPAPPPKLSWLEQRTVHFATTPLLYTEDDAKYGRVSLVLWDVEVAFLFRRGESAFAPLQAPVKGAPVLGALVTAGEGHALALKASGHPVAMRDWGDERRNLGNAEFLQYVTGEYAVFTVLMEAQRALNAAVPGRDDLDPLVHLAVIRHADNAHAAVALAETQGAKKALSLLKAALGRNADFARASGDQLRQAAGEAARALLGEPPPEWPGFTFEPQSRYLTMQQARELAR